MLDVASACGGSGGAEGRERPVTTSESTTMTQPDASSIDAVAPIIEDLVVETSDIATRLATDPSAVSDPDNEDVARFRELYTADSPVPDGVITHLTSLAEKGHRWRPGPSGVMRNVGVYRLVAVNDDVVQFRVCEIEDVEIVDGGGSVVERRSQIIQGDGEARRIDGAWRFYGTDLDESASLPVRPGSSPADFCDRLLGDGQ